MVVKTNENRGKSAQPPGTAIVCRNSCLAFQNSPFYFKLDNSIGLNMADLKLGHRAVQNLVTRGLALCRNQVMNRNLVRSHEVMRKTGGNLTK